MCNKSIKMHRNEAKNIMHVINLQTLSQKNIGGYFLNKGKRRSIALIF